MKCSHKEMKSSTSKGEFGTEAKATVSLRNDKVKVPKDSMPSFKDGRKS